MKMPIIFAVIWSCIASCDHGSIAPDSCSQRDVGLEHASGVKSHQALTADGVFPVQNDSGVGRIIRSQVDLYAIPENWKRDVATAVQRIGINLGNRVFAFEEEIVSNGGRQQLIFTLYEDGPDMVHRIDTYKIDRYGNVYVSDDLADEVDMWVPLP